jgi:Tfp pilus assembly protein PilZ
VYQGEEQVGYGVLTNVSEAGACIVTDGALELGSDLRVKLSFYDQPRLFETAARVVWSRQATTPEAGLAGLRLHGLRFTVTSTSERARLLQILQCRDAFTTLFEPTETEFNRLQSSLEGELDALGEKLDKSVGHESV